MALSNYSELITSISDWAARTDTAVTSLADDFLDIAEAEIYSHLRVRAMESRSRATLSSGERRLPLPDGFLEMRSLTIILAGNDGVLPFYTQAGMKERQGPSKPQSYTITAELEFDTESDADYTIESHYYKRLTALSGSNTTNWLLTNKPQVLLDGALWALNDYVENDQRSNRYYQKMINGIERLNEEQTRGRVAPNVRPRFVAV